LASLPTKSFNAIVTNTIAGIQGRASKLINFSTGSTLRAIVEGFAGLFLWFQAMVLQVLQATRLSTSSGTDVDTFTADFMPTISGSQTTALPNGSPRLGAQAASGQVTFSRFTAGPSSCFIPVGATVQTSDGQQNFAVIADTTFATYSAGPPAGYTLPSSVADIIVPVQAVVAAAAGNVSSGAIATMTSPITGIDTVNNVSAFTNGADFESDSALKSRFSAYILGLSRGDFYGLNASLLGAAVNVQFKLTEGYNYDGSYRPGFFFVVVDDGSGTPSPAFLAMALEAANAVRPLGVQCAVFPPVVILANVSMQIATAAGYDHNTVVAQVAALVALNINSVGLGNPLPWSQLAAWAYQVPGVTSVSNVLLNSASTDAASISAYKLSQDRTYAIAYATIKSGAISIS
jgi:uncharacterized phage protein gp47/JayE